MRLWRPRALTRDFGGSVHGVECLQHYNATMESRSFHIVLDLDGQDLIRNPLDRRRATLSRVTEGTGVLCLEPLPGTPEQIKRAVRELALKSVIAKHRGSFYEPGRRSSSW